MLQIALPNKGALAEDALRLVQEAGYRIRRSRRDLAVRDAENEAEFLFLRPRDIATYVSSGVLELGITGQDLAADSGVDVHELLALGFGKARFHYAVPQESTLTPDDLGGLRVATSYVRLVEEDLARRGVEAAVVPLDGAVGISIRLGVADAVADVVQTGQTLEQAGLRTTGEPLLRSEAVLIGRNGEAGRRAGVRQFVERLRGIIVARAFVMVEYDIPKAQMQEAVVVTPGIEAPTIAPLSKEGWVAVKAMVRQPRVNPVMDRLSALGAKGILVTDIRTCRI